MADNTPDDFAKAMEGRSHRPAPMPDATGGPIIALGALMAAFGLYVFHTGVLQPLRGIPGATFQFQSAAAAPVIVALGVFLMVGYRRLGADKQNVRFEKMFFRTILGLFFGGLAFAFWLRVFVL